MTTITVQYYCKYIKIVMKRRGPDNLYDKRHDQITFRFCSVSAILSSSDTKPGTLVSSGDFPNEKGFI